MIKKLINFKFINIEINFGNLYTNVYLFIIALNCEV